jgi:hypothetical protein
MPQSQRGTTTRQDRAKGRHAEISTKFVTIIASFIGYTKSEH